MENNSIDEFANEQIDEQESDFNVKINEDDWINIVGDIPNDPVNHPKHYKWFDTEVIEVMEKVLSTEEYLGFLKGNSLKYRMRAGKKNTVFEDIRKAMFYEDLYQKFINENTPY